MDDILGLIEGIPWEERAAGGETSRLLAQMLARKASEKMARSLDFQSESEQLNQTLFNNSTQENPEGEQPTQLDEHPQTPPLMSLDDLETPALGGGLPGEEDDDELAVEELF